MVGTVVCGDGLFADHADETARRALALIEGLAPDLVVAGPAFAAGRYGLACGRVCADVAAQLGRPALTGMHPENAAVAVYRGDLLIVPTAASALGMAEAIAAMAGLALKLGRGERLGPPRRGGYLPSGRRLNTRVERSASERAIDMLLARRRGEPVVSEVPLPQYDRVTPPAPLADLAASPVSPWSRKQVIASCAEVASACPAGSQASASRRSASSGVRSSARRCAP